MPCVGSNMAHRFSPASSWRMAQRLLLAIVGGYFLAVGIAALMSLALSRVMPPSEAGTLMAMLAFVIYLALLLWAFAERRSARLWWVLGLGGALAFGGAEMLPALTGAPHG